MGSYCELYIGDYPVFSSKSHVWPVIMTLFRESDKSVYARKVNERNSIEWGRIEERGDELETAVEYRALVKHVRQRLNILGFTLKRVRDEFDQVRTAEAQKLREWSEDDGYHLWDKDIAVLESSSFEDYLEAYKVILESGVHPVYSLDKFPDAPQLIRYILKENEEFHWGFPCEDIRCFFRALLEISPDEALVVEDLTEVVIAGYYTEEDNIFGMAIHELIGDYPINSKIIVLTEGPTDTEVLQPSLRLLYPYLYDYFSFMDFGVKLGGGVGPLVHAVKSFAGAGIENRVIALFDNDTSAFSAVESLKDSKIPKNITILHYPDIELARKYPTIGPNGIAHQDINGLACSIELYFGKDVLEREGSCIPIQWKGYDERLRRYQGEILHKAELKKRFLEKLKRCQENAAVINEGDWGSIHSILRHIFDAFNA
jgi:hypothetical protein